MGWLGDAVDWLGGKGVRFKRGTLRKHYRDTFDTDAGRVVLADLHRRVAFMDFTPGLSNAERQYEAGRRDVVSHIDTMLRIESKALPNLSNIEVIDD